MKRPLKVAETQKTKIKLDVSAKGALLIKRLVGHDFNGQGN